MKEKIYFLELSLPWTSRMGLRVLTKDDLENYDGWSTWFVASRFEDWYLISEKKALSVGYDDIDIGEEACEFYDFVKEDGEYYLIRKGG